MSAQRWAVFTDPDKSFNKDPAEFLDIELAVKNLDGGRFSIVTIFKMNGPVLENNREKIFVIGGINGLVFLCWLCYPENSSVDRRIISKYLANKQKWDQVDLLCIAEGFGAEEQIPAFLVSTNTAVGVLQAFIEQATFDLWRSDVEWVDYEAFSLQTAKIFDQLPHG